MHRTVILIVLLAISAMSTFAQEPSDNTYTMYYENPNPEHLDWELWHRNICPERVMQLNPDLDMTDVDYGTQIRLPLDEPCYDGSPMNSIYTEPPRLKYYEHGEWLEEPYYTDNIDYIWDSTVDDTAAMYGVCVDDLLTENILLQDFEKYADFTTLTTMDIFIPQGTPSCKPSDKPQDKQYKLIVTNTRYQNVTPYYFATHYNICAEEVAKSVYPYEGPNETEIAFRVWNETPPCYNKQGQRLSYYDAQGEKRVEPVYSDLPVYVTQPGDTMPIVADRHGVCLIDLLRHNGFLNLSINLNVELFIPPSRPCPTDITVVQTASGITETISHELNICKDILLELNSQLRHYVAEPATRIEPYNRLSPNSNSLSRWIITPAQSTPCYTTYHAKEGESVYDIERDFNVCFEEFDYQGYRWQIDHFLLKVDTTLYIPIDHQPCFNQSGERLYYPQDDFLPYTTYDDDPYQYDPTPAPYYTDMALYYLKRGDTAYGISLQFNVCVYDLLETNPILQHYVFAGIRIFIPDTRPCYDDVTGLPLIYEDENGHSLSKPEIGDHLIHYGNQPTERISRYYNVCENRIKDANRAKLDREASYLGWIIPTNRPPCYDVDWNPIDYACYSQPLDMSTDYRNSDDVISLDYDGTYCYDLADPATVVWHENKPYRVINYHGNILKSRAFTAWCYGVSLAEINAINAQSAVLNLLSPYTRLIPKPIRDCYLDHPEVLEKASIVHIVQWGETLSDIAAQYDMPYQLIALANDLDTDHTIWCDQKLIIPDGFTWRGLIAFGGSVVATGLLMLLMYRRQHRTYHKKKGIPKNDTL